MSDTLAIIGLIAEATLKFINNSRYKIFGYRVFKSERIGKLGLTFKLISSLQQFKTPLIACYNLVLVCKDITPKYGRTSSKRKFSFLDIEVIREQGKFSTTIYRKPTFSGVYSNFERFLPSVYKFGMVYTLAYRCFRICSDWKKFHAELTFQ